MRQCSLIIWFERQKQRFCEFSIVLLCQSVAPSRFTSVACCYLCVAKNWKFIRRLSYQIICFKFYLPRLVHLFIHENTRSLSLWYSWHRLDGFEAPFWTGYHLFCLVEKSKMLSIAEAIERLNKLAGRYLLRSVFWNCCLSRATHKIGCW